MINQFDPLRIRMRLGRKDWKPPYEYIAGQWLFDSKIEKHHRIIVSCAPYLTNGIEDVEWLHASVSREEGMPDYLDLKTLHEAVFEDRWAYQIFAPPSRHINIHSYALHLWGRLDGKMIHPDFQVLSGLNSV